jgi:predicted phosphodiesterase
MRHLFVSDLHLDDGAPAAIDAFCGFLGGDARDCDALYVLGDLFESWIGDDDDDPARARVVDALAGLARSGTAVFVMRGNRDFLLGPGFEARSGCRLLPDPVVATLHGCRVLLTHGDAPPCVVKASAPPCSHCRRGTGAGWPTPCAPAAARTRRAPGQRSWTSTRRPSSPRCAPRLPTS